LCCTFTREDLLNRNTLAYFDQDREDSVLKTIKAPLENKRVETLNQIVDSVLNQILGQESTQIIYEYLENKYFIQRHEIAEKLDSFNRALEEYLGTGAVVIKRVILQNLELCGLDENKDADFSERQKIVKLA